MLNVGNFPNDTIPFDRYAIFTRAQKLTFSQLNNITQHIRLLVTERPQLQHREVKTVHNIRTHKNTIYTINCQIQIQI